MKKIKSFKEEIRLFLPAIKTCMLSIATFIATSCFAVMTLKFDITLDFKTSIFALLMAILGFLYALYIEYNHHKNILHSKTSGIFKKFTADHILHHRLFRRGTYQTRDEKLLKHVITFWPTFPVLYGMYFLALTTLSIFFEVPYLIILGFLFGLTCEDIYFEFTHFALHVKDSMINKLFNSTKKQLHHKAHHDKMSGNFGVTTTQFDVFFGTNHQ